MLTYRCKLCNKITLKYVYNKYNEYSLVCRNFRRTTAFNENDDDDSTIMICLRSNCKKLWYMQTFILGR